MSSGAAAQTAVFGLEGSLWTSQRLLFHVGFVLSSLTKFLHLFIKINNFRLSVHVDLLSQQVVLVVKSSLLHIHFSGVHLELLGAAVTSAGPIAHRRLWVEFFGSASACDEDDDEDDEDQQQGGGEDVAQRQEKMVPLLRQNNIDDSR